MTQTLLAQSDAVATPSSTASSFADKGEAAFNSGDYAGAVYSWKHAIVDTPQNPVLGLMLGQALFATAKYDEAAGTIQAALNQIPKDKWGVVVQNSRELYGNYQDYTAQLRALEAAARTKTTDPGLRFLLGYNYAYLGYPQQAVDQLEKLIALAPGDEIGKQLRDEMRAKVANPAGGTFSPPPSGSQPINSIVPPRPKKEVPVPPPASEDFSTTSTDVLQAPELVPLPPLKSTIE